ncbi:hypothetical protein [Nocardioides yefusunii]|uniref:Uncharacterized protein n=1 Tax=Nocardioides yefusunii TaxID=2500546 RepID=A0ABW1QXX9_9ACTN|nr:hypothetical protein [Nocardioides yefusunii]
MPDQPDQSDQTASEPALSLQFFLAEDGSLAGAHTVGLAARGVPEVLLPMRGTDAPQGWALTVGEVHDLLHGWIDDAVTGEFTAGTSIDAVLPSDDATLHLRVSAPLTVGDVEGAEGTDDPTRTVHVVEWTVTPGPSPRPLAPEMADYLVGAVNGLRLAAGLATVPEDEFDFSATAPYAIGTPMIEALSASVRSMSPSQVSTWHAAWMELLDGGYRPDIALATCDTLARRVGRGDAWDAAYAHADEVAKEILGSDGPSETLMETCALLFEQVGVEDEETQQLLLGRIAVMLHDQVRTLLTFPVVEDVADEEVSVPPLQAWFAGLTLDNSPLVASEEE